MILKPHNLPNEILESILLYLPRSSLYKCIYVNKSWSLSALALFYKEITISMEDFNMTYKFRYIQLYRKRFEKLIIKDSPYYYRVGNRDSGLFLRWIFGDLPGLKVIDFSKDKALFSRLFPLIRSSEFKINLPRIEEIIVRDFFRVPKESSSSSEVLTVYHLPLCRRVCKTIKRLSFSNVTLRSWMDCIHLYQRLTHLTIHNDYPFKVLKNYDELLLTFFLCQCPSLIDFTLLNSFYIPDKSNGLSANIQDICQKVIGYESSSITVNENIPKYVLSGPHFNLVTLSLSLSTINTSQMKYFISYMPSLKSLKLRLTRMNIHTWLDQNCETIILQFAKHLSFIKDLIFTMSVIASSVSVESISPTIHRQTDLLCRFLTELKGSRDIQTSYTTLHLFLNRRPANKLSNFSFQIENDINLYFEYAMTCADLLLRNQTNLSSPFLLAISPIIMIGRRKRLNIAMTKSESNSVLQYALANFNHIDILKIYTFVLNFPENPYDDRYVTKYVRENGTTIAHVRDMSFTSNDCFPDVNILALESDRLVNHSIDAKSKTWPNYFYDDSLEQEVPKDIFILDLIEHKRLQELHIKVSKQEGLILFQFKNIKYPKDIRISFVTYQNTCGDLKRVENDARLKPKGNIPLEYVSVFYIETMSNIENFNVWK